MPSLNKVHLIGNVGRDPELRSTPSGTQVCALSIATSRSWKDKTSGDKMEETEWHRVVFYDRLAEIAAEYAKKGKPIYVEGRLKTRKWQDKDGKDVNTTEVIAENLQLLGGREGAEPATDRPAARSAPPAARTAPPARAAAPARQPAPSTGTGFDDMDDDIPF